MSENGGGQVRNDSGLPISIHEGKLEKMIERREESECDSKISSTQNAENGPKSEKDPFPISAPEFLKIYSHLMLDEEI